MDSKDGLRYNCEYATQEIEDIIKSGDVERFADWTSDVLGIRYSIDGCFNYISVRLTLAYGGPNIYLDTDSKEIEGYWGTNHYSIPVSDDVIGVVDKWYENLFEEEYR